MRPTAMGQGWRRGPRAGAMGSLCALLSNKLRTSRKSASGFPATHLVPAANTLLDCGSIMALDFIDMQGTIIDEDAVDLESGMSLAMREQEGTKDVASSAGQGKNALYKGSNDSKGEQVPNRMAIHAELPVANAEISLDRRDGEEKESLLKLGAEKVKKKRCKKPPKPPRPPTSSPFDDTDQKLIREISELAMMKRARIERMKKIHELAFYAGALSRSNSNINHHGSPESSVQVRGGFISLQFNKGASVNGLNAPHLASPPYASLSYSYCSQFSKFFTSYSHSDSYYNYGKQNRRITDPEGLDLSPTIYAEITCSSCKE
ncbi:hypothetical protein ZIOFF_004198 [Zingiber officinale]|uniref:Uncharacterized protein n=1 Tax=Zingiber officinale TaxID=94328 RepID=A0A8J5INV6_ZINOF|nr:hypothetical protein ZIOFF_004198 [Zingiber officinale]